MFNATIVSQEIEEQVKHYGKEIPCDSKGILQKDKLTGHAFIYMRCPGNGEFRYDGSNDFCQIYCTVHGSFHKSDWGKPTLPVLETERKRVILLVALQFIGFLIGISLLRCIMRLRTGLGN
ncbi:MAG: hypothetical protein PHP62_06140 [Candidatus Moranbacteria bacterium]|nr:hypothetical protein [Candidatus Moranbacteria bacterium]